MNFAIPRNNISELILYIWKIIDLPTISAHDLIFKISFDLFLESPENANIIVQKAIFNGILTETVNGNLKLSRELSQKLHTWQKKSKKDIIKWKEQNQKKEKLIKILDKEKTSDFGVLLNAFLDKGTINRAVAITDDAFKINEFDFSKGIIKVMISGSKEESYVVSIDVNNKKLQHNCHDFQTNRVENKKFCKHLAKLFLLLKEKDEATTSKILSNIAENINQWEFFG